MNKNEFLAFSLPYGLKVEVRNEERGTTRFIELQPKWLQGKSLENKPILHPLSDLTKEIEHKGEKFVPMIGLWKIVSKDGNDYKLTADSIEDRNAFVVFPKDDKSRLLGYHIPTNSFFGATNDKPCSVAKQLDLFQKLIEWHFDIADLISKGEAIDVNTLEENPYK